MMILVRLRSFLAVLCVCLSVTPMLRGQLKTVGDGGAGPVKAQHLTAELTTAAGTIAPGGTVEAGLVLTLEQKWHVYWINAGDAGEAPHITWTLPKGITAAEMQFPIPMRLPLGPLMDFGYENAVTLPFTISAAKGTAQGPAHLDAVVTWVVCSSVCVPGKAHLGIDLKVSAGAPMQQTAAVGALAEARTLLPQPLPAGASVSVSGGKDEYVVTLLSGDTPDDAEIYPFDQNLIANAMDQDVQQVAGGVRVWVPRAPDSGALPKQLHALIRLSDEKAYEFTAAVTPGEIPEPATSSQTVAHGGTQNVTALGAVGLAFLGGILLNLMPCVFPVLFLKGLALVQSSGERRSTLRAHGLVYALGILVSFWAIVAVLLALRTGTNQIGWGFQLQSPAFVAALAIGIFFFALSLAGQFELGLSVTSAGDSLTRKQGFTGSFFTGVLAVVVATPYTAPLMGAAIGFALAQSAAITFAVFTALALGLALPYLLLTLQPSWTRWLPRPGAWMETLKQLTALPLFATVVWLVWVFGRLFSAGADGVDRAALMIPSARKLATSCESISTRKSAMRAIVPFATTTSFNAVHSCTILSSRRSTACIISRVSMLAWLVHQASSVPKRSDSGTSVRKPSDPRLTDRIGVLVSANDRAAAIRVPSPPSTITRFGLRSGSSGRGTPLAPGT